MKKIVIIGAGFTGLSAAFHLNKLGYRVQVLEHQSYPGGLAAGFKAPHWSWSLEHHYHHIFTTDTDIIYLAHLTNLNHLLQFTSTKTSILFQNRLYPFDSPASLFTFPHLNPASKIRTAASLALLKLSPTWKPFESLTAARYLKQTTGLQSWETLWSPLFDGKFGSYAPEINAAWFWARIKVRTKKLGYFTGGFLNFAQALTQHLKHQGVKFKFSSTVTSINPHHPGFIVKLKNQPDLLSDLVLFTTPSPQLLQLLPDLPAPYQKQISALKGLAAQTLILSLKKPFFADSTYWLNINQPGWPFLAVVEHTNFMPKKHYGDQHLVYIGKYLAPNDPNYQLNQPQLLDLYTPYLRQLSPNFTQHLNHAWLFKANFAQPIVTLNHSQHVPSMTTPIKGIYWSSMQHVYPHDRGTNYAVKLGLKAAQFIHHDSQT